MQRLVLRIDIRQPQFAGRARWRWWCELTLVSMGHWMERLEFPRSRAAASQRAPWLLRGFGLRDAARRHALHPTSTLRTA
jgi:hypothetical protein